MTKKILLSFILTPILLFEFFLGFQTFWGEKIVPQVEVGAISLAALTQSEARQRLEMVTTKIKQGSLKIEIEDKTFEVVLKDLGLEFEIEKAVIEAYSVGHSINLFGNFAQTLSLVKQPVKLKMNFLLEEQKLDVALAELAKNFETEIVESKLEIRNQKVEFVPGKAGKKVEKELLKRQVFDNLSRLKLETILAQVSTVKPEIPEELANEAKLAAAKFIGKKITLAAADQNFEIGPNEILQLLSPVGNFKNFDLTPNKSKVERFVRQNLDSKISKAPVDAKFQFDGRKAVAFTPSVDGVALDIEKSTELIFQALENLGNRQQIALPVTVTPAKVKTAEVNNLGISELIGRGVSNFAGSASERIHNIKLAASKINGILIAPSETFSFNQTVGEISTATGYTSAYIISKGRTILGEGGGVCQVSTTIFRAAVGAGLEIVERRAHAYRVRYYEQGGHKVGLDATIFIPSVDFKFRNDGQNYILIQAYTKGSELYFDFYSTSDGRVVEISKPVVTNVRPAPPPQYEEDPTLPAGVTKQVDFAATGATVTVKTRVVKNGQILHSDTFMSDYKPWQAIFKVGTKTQ